MNGVIIWSEQVSKGAIIWREDHGRLAFFKVKKRFKVNYFVRMRCLPMKMAMWSLSP